MVVPHCTREVLLHGILWTLLLAGCSILLCAVAIPPTTTKEIIVYMLAFTSSVWPALLFTSGKTLTKLALLVAAIGYLHQWRLAHVSRDFHVHCYIGLMLLFAGSSIATSKGPLTIDATLGAFGVFAVVVGLAVQMQTTILGRTLVPMHAKHVVYYFLVGCFILGAALQSYLENRRPSLQSAIARLTEVRWLLDPACFAAMGIGFYFHQHDKRPVGVIFHRWLGLMFLAISATYLCKGFASTRFCHDTRIFRLASMLAAFSFVLSGAWMVRMAAFLYVYDSHDTGRIGLHHLIWKASIIGDEALTLEACSLYLGIDIMLSAIVVSFIVSCREGVGANTYAVLQECGEFGPQMSCNSLDDKCSKDLHCFNETAIAIDLSTKSCSVIGAVDPMPAEETPKPDEVYC